MTLLRDDSESLENIRPKLEIVLRACFDGLTTTGVGFWSNDNLLRYVITRRVNIMLECFDSIRDDIEARRWSPIPRIARSMFEDLTTFEYCVEDCPNTLARWVKDGLADHKKFLDDYLRYDAETDPHRVYREPRERQEKAKIEKLLVDAPESTTRALPCFKERRNKVWGDRPAAKRIYRLSYQYPSGWVHSTAQGAPDLGVMSETVHFSLWLIVNRAMQICVDKKLVGWEDRNRAKGIVEVCEQRARLK